MTTVLDEIRAECEHRRQQAGSSEKDDDKQTNPQSLALGAAALTLAGQPGAPRVFLDDAPSWVREAIRTRGSRQRLIRACVLLVAELERHDRLMKRFRR